MSKMLAGSPILIGDNTVPGIEISEKIRKQIVHILKLCRDFGCDFYDTVVEFLPYDDISEIAAYGGFPNRYPHWRHGMEYEELSRGYEYGMQKISEMVVNTNPCYIYCLDSNSDLDHYLVVAHATGHNDFFKNNIFFSPTNSNMMNELADHGSRIRRYEGRRGRERVTEFIDKCLSIETLLDPAAAWKKRVCKQPVLYDKVQYFHPRRLKTDHDYMEDWINPTSWIKNENVRAKDLEIRKELSLFEKPTRDIMGYIKDHAPLQPWQADIIAMLYEEAQYFVPQRLTKMLNEGWASYIDSAIMARIGYANSDDIIEYALHKAAVLGGKYSMNPYKLGYHLFLYVEELWNKGKFGNEWENCQDMRLRKEWDKKLGLGHDKVFEVRQNYNDVMAIAEFFDQDFCDQHEFYQTKLMPNGEYVIESRDAKEIKRVLINKYLNGGLPDIQLVDPNFLGKKHLLLQHSFDGRTLHPKYSQGALSALAWLWKNPVALASQDKNKNEIIFWALENGKTGVVPRDEYRSLFSGPING